ncbi:hypothetical protein SAMN05421743_101395 [Thalassobacillus cyri]|uniref:Uncharacterized protein n=1 Tax=Thalassobacillus cyri TaxID=571932 RepID=A0A1H3WBE0_9BACI|nr:hypothetical protein [Thalassobacillus cyri]SDZ84426.1 hypothetical protein SAMN05421743_101395 [Thalassobacillus cyri]
MPASILASLLVTIIFEMSYVYNWWTVQKAIAQWGHITSIPLVYGAFLIGTIWILRYTFDKGFKFYIIANAIVDAIYAFIGLNILIYLGIYRLENMGNLGDILFNDLFGANCVSLSKMARHNYEKRVRKKVMIF